MKNNLFKLITATAILSLLLTSCNQSGSESNIGSVISTETLTSSTSEQENVSKDNSAESNTSSSESNTSSSENNTSSSTDNGDLSYQISYKETEPLEAQYAWVKKMKEIGFEIIIVSNNSHKERVSRFAELLDIKYLNFALKPTKIGMKKALKMAQQKYNSNEVVALGDQLMTDILVANRMKFHSILVKAVDRKSDILPTRINRKLERHVLKVLRKKNSESYKEKLSAYVEDSYGKN